MEFVLNLISLSPDEISIDYKPVKTSFTSCVFYIIIEFLISWDIKYMAILRFLSFVLL